MTPSRQNVTADGQVEVLINAHKSSQLFGELVWEFVVSLNQIVQVLDKEAKYDMLCFWWENREEYALSSSMDVSGAMNGDREAGKEQR